MSFAKERERRPNAGSRMRALLNQEIEMEELFEYKENDESDQEFPEQMMEEEEDVVDSDFDLDSSEGEQEQIEEGQEMDKKIAKEEKKSRKSTFNPTIPKAFKVTRKPTEQRKRKRDVDTVQDREDRTVRQSSRRNTMLNRILLEDQIKEHEKKKALQPKRDRAVSAELTQEELLAEAAVTEEKNKSSLLEWQKKESERKANAKIKGDKELSGPFIRYHSFIERCTEDGDGEASEDKELFEPMGRNLITFVEETEDEKKDELDLDSAGLIHHLSPWLVKEPKPNKPILCPISGETAKYRDPCTAVPFANLDAYKVIKSCLDNQMNWSPTLGIYLGNLPSANGTPEGWNV
ncbi:YL1-domain-containing protein [Rhizopus microsporus var. microsporus]|uniref:YL1-domain-containing protein n=2 Tax=Rhizopus microsporus TaxID=58291 RepID=A0A2G4T6A8_RHIZD|nr:YL1-domain-containing protein [Rhizopus microsporus ATCC 52813]ORE06328.1 YL1-domain-containing protein [Rhizopus microsporus var. microsporus]PHZ16555.1 YL1-domain-containing protein [Rhizopus microsporus ATCC 52813]